MYGRKKISRMADKKSKHIIRLKYGSRAIEWFNLRKLFLDILVFFSHSHLSPKMDEITFAWCYMDNLARTMYRPAEVFKKFSFVHLLDHDTHCACEKATRLKKFIDENTMNETSSFRHADVHVRTMDLNIIQHPLLKEALAQGLNHIPLRPTNIGQAVAVACDAFIQLCLILNLTEHNFPINEATQRIQNLCLSTLKASSKMNKLGIRNSAKYLLDIPAVQNEINWLLKHLYCVGLDKASNNASFICIQHIRLQALERLNGNDFSPCKENAIWSLHTNILDQITNELKLLLPECPHSLQSLPYLMATYKQHKGKYRWITNASKTIFSNIAILLTVTSNLILDTFKIWARKTEKGYKNFLQVDTSLFWIIDSVTDAILNLPTQIHDIFVADITRCYECIPLDGPNNLLEAISYIIKISFKEASLLQIKKTTCIWVRTDKDGTAYQAKWATNPAGNANWISINMDRIIMLHSWLITNCYITLGDRVWRQCKGIPMGFSCSPIWCNMYLLSYEARFIQRLAKLGRQDLMSRFQHPFRYIDDLCLINVQTPRIFLDPKEEQIESNPFWIYPLQILEIKEETTAFCETNPEKGISARFMNMEIHVNTDDMTKYQFQKYDKRRALPFAYTQYIKFLSNRPIAQAYNIAISQVIPILYVSSTDLLAINEIQLLIDTMVKNGFRKARLIRTIQSFLVHGTFPAIRVDIGNISKAIALQ